MNWEYAAAVITASSPLLLYVLSVFLRTADQRAKSRGDAEKVVVQTGADVQPSAREQALLQDIEQERKIARLEERNRALIEEKERLLRSIDRRDAKIHGLNETIRVLRENRQQ